MPSSRQARRSCSMASSSSRSLPRESGRSRRAWVTRLWAVCRLSMAFSSALRADRTWIDRISPSWSAVSRVSKARSTSRTPWDSRSMASSRSSATGMDWSRVRDIRALKSLAVSTVPEPQFSKWSAMPDTSFRARSASSLMRSMWSARAFPEAWVLFRVRSRSVLRVSSSPSSF